MAALKIKEIMKTFPARHPDAGKFRYTKIYSKIQLGEPFKMVSGPDVRLEFATKTIENSFKTGTGVDKFTNTQMLFKELSGTRSFRIDQLEKTKEFGGGGGSGAGAALTDLGESAQCLYAALAFYVLGRKIKEDEVITLSQFEKATAFIDVTDTLKKMTTELPEEWEKSSIRGANKLFDKFGSARGAKRYKFHRGSDTVKKIESTWRGIASGEGIRMDINKWSPADIYMIAEQATPTVLAEHNSIKGLNNEMLIQYNNKDIIGVSLKKIEQPTARLSEINVETTTKGSKGNGSVKFYGFTVMASPTSDIYNSMDAYIQWGQGKQERMQIRSFGDGEGLTGFQGELKGESANQGKISLGPMSYLIKEHTGIVLPTSAEIANRARTKDQAFAVEILDMAKKLGVTNLPNQDLHMKKSFDEELHGGKSARWRYSKYLAMKICLVFQGLSQKDADALIFDMYSYAGSKSSLSAPYAKVE